MRKSGGSTAIRPVRVSRLTVYRGIPRDRCERSRSGRIADVGADWTAVRIASLVEDGCQIGMREFSQSARGIHDQVADIQLRFVDLWVASVELELRTYTTLRPIVENHPHASSRRTRTMTPLQTPKQRRTDAEIFAEARHALDQRRTVPATVGVHVDDGTVRLTGAVYWPFERAEAEDAVRTIEGVERIINDVTIAREPRKEGFEAPDEVC